MDLKVPEGSKMEPAQLERYVSFANENGLSQAQAQKLLERDLAAEKAAGESTKAALKQQDQRWLTDLQTEWGPKYVENGEHSKRGFDLLDPDGSMRKDMESIGVANWPKLVKAAERLGRMMAEDKLHAPNAGKTEPKLTPEQKLRQGYEENAKGAKK